jgi:hypothetical protein
MTSAIGTNVLNKINKQTLLFFLHNFFINVGTTLVYVSANVLLLENHPEYSLPFAYIAAALTVMLAGRIYEHYEHHLALRKLSLGTMSAALFMVAVVMVLLSIGHGIATAIAIMVGYRVIYLLINLEFWGLSALVFDVRQSKRVFGVIGSGDMPAKALGAVLAVLIHSPSVLMILLVISIVFFALALYTQILTFRHTDIPNPHHARPRKTSHDGSKVIQKYFEGNKLLSALCIGMVAVAAAATWIEYHFFVNVKYKFHSQHDVIVFVGTLLTATYLISTLVKVLLSGKVVERFGVKYALYLLPLTTVVVSLGLLISSYFRKDEPSLLVYYCAAYLLFEIVRRTIFDSVFLVLFQPLSTKNRLKGHTLAKGFYEPLGMLIAGLILWLIYRNHISNISLTFDLSLLFAVAALFVFRKAYSAYIVELKNAISKRFIRSGELPSQAEALPIIKENIKSSRKEEVINAIEWLARNDVEALKNNIDFLLKNPAVQVRLKTLQSLALIEEPELSSFFFLYIETETDTPCQTLAVRIACKSPKLSGERLSRYLAHADADIVRGAIIGCWEVGKSLPLVHGTLRRLLASENENDQLTAISCLNVIGLQTYDDHLKKLIAGGTPAVHEAAMITVISHGTSGQIAALNFNAPKSISRKVIAALINAGAAGEEALTQWLSDDTSDRNLFALVKTAEKNKSDFIQSILFELLKRIYLLESNKLKENITLSLHLSVLKSLSYYSVNIDQQAVTESFIHKEIAFAFQLFKESDSAEDDRTWQDALQYELALCQQRLFYIFMMRYERDSVVNAWKGIRHSSKEKRANSLEMIENLIPRSLYPVLRALFEDSNAANKLEVLRQYLGNQPDQQPLQQTILQVQERQFTPWTIALAIRKQPHGTIFDNSILGHSNNLIREAALQTTMKASHNPVKVSEIERIIVLKNTQLFSHTPENVLSSIAPIMKEVEFQEGQQIFAKGDVGDSMYVIYAGEIGIYDGIKQLARFDKGEIFGELALLDTEPRSATTVAETDVLLFRIDQEDFFELMEERDEILKNVLKILCQRIRVQNEKMRLSSGTI